MGGTTEGGRGSFRGKGRHGRSVQGRGIVAGGGRIVLVVGGVGG